MSPESVFQARQTQFKSSIAAIQKQLDQIALVRLGVFLMAAGVQIASWGWGGAWWLLCLMAGLIGFGLTVKWNEAVNKRLRYQRLLLQFNEEEERRLKGDLKGFDEGAEFIDPAHPYTSDLDIFGKHSLYQLLSRATTVFGRAKLAEWLQNPVGKAKVTERQEAGKQMAPLIDWRQEFQAIGKLQDSQGENPEVLRRWMQEPGFVSQRPWLGFLPWVMIPLAAVEGLLEIFGQIPSGYFFLIMGFNFLVNRMINGRVQRIQSASEERGRLLAAWSEMLAKIESLEVSAPAVATLKQRLSTQGSPASAEIARLGRIVGNLEFRNSGLPHFFMNTLFYWDVFCLKALEKWKRELGERIVEWFEVIGEMEALNSLAAVRFAFPAWTDAETVEGSFLLEGEAIGHPLIGQQQRIDNPISLPGNGAIWLVTGSNMSGKSTYLRTVGLNAVLALTGSPVCANKLRLSPMEVVTSMRTIDSLEENTSSFYAELKRLHSVIEIVKANPNVLFLLDEILKGTNSRDRQAGARALVQQLHKYGGSGLVSTHDIELVDMAGQMPEDIHNYSFNCTVTPDGQLHFDYLLTPGQCLSMNATALMRAMGIEV
ncbi:MAG: hypothetical protein KA239_10470 [Bacteroidia bacterium]|nr:hypothetical protein [Bacteroidia bacterium]